MSTDAPNLPDEAGDLQVRSRKPLLARIRPSIPDWRPAAKRAAGAVAAIAAVGAVLGGLAGFWSTYKVVGEWFGQKPAVVAQGRPDAPAAFDPPRLSIALLPFDNLSGDAAQDYFADGIVENLTTDLSVNIANLLVIARGAAFSYKGQKVDPKTVGRELNVRYLLQGSALRTGKDVRINARLIDAGSGEQIWAERFDGETSNTLALQDQITARISNSLRWAFLSVENRATSRRQNPDAFDLVLRAQAKFFDERRLGINPRKESQEFYRKALAIEPDNADALVGLGLVLAEDRFNSGWVFPRSVRPGPEQIKQSGDEALELLNRGIRLKPASSDAHYGKAYLLAYDQKFADALQELERALSINPNNAAALNLLAGTYNLMGKPEKALPVLDDILLRTAGKSPGYRIILDVWGRAYMLAGRWQESIEKYEKAQALRSDPGSNLQLAAAYAQLGNLVAAREHLAKFQAWNISQFGSELTIRKFRPVAEQLSSAPEHLKLLNATLYDGLRKAGMVEE